MSKIVAIIVIALLILLGQPAFIINEAEQALILEFGKPVRIIHEPGLYFKYPFVQDLITFDKRVLVAEAKPAEYITLDKKRLTVDTVTRWKIVKPLEFYQSVTNYRGAIGRLNNIIIAPLREEIANHEFKGFIREEREKIVDRVTKETAQLAKRFGIEVVDVRIKRVDLP
ncbi:MAG: protease modulator HflC, partial [Deltaproteobacteria bacterium]|nr:protease modulator HflC [Deltaproteobacteria bacterium]